MALRSLKDVFGFSPDLAAEEEAMRRQLVQAGEEIARRLAWTRLACDLYDAHVSSPDEHSCLGCNLNDSVQELAAFLADDTGAVGAMTRFSMYLYLVNILWERIVDVCETVNLPPELWRDGAHLFPSFKTARAWANFAKHPGFFGMGIHHPVFLVADGPGTQDAIHADTIRSRSAEPEWVLIDTAFVKEYWSGDHTGREARSKLSAPFTACVLFPSPFELSRGICSEFESFVRRMTEPTWVEQARRFALCEVPCVWW